jgi:hypothetical protein
MKENEQQAAGVVEAFDPVGDALVVRWRRPMPPDGDLDGDDPARRQFGNFWPIAAVDDAGRQMKKEIDDAGARRLLSSTPGRRSLASSFSNLGPMPFSPLADANSGLRMIGRMRTLSCSTDSYRLKSAAPSAEAAVFKSSISKSAFPSPVTSPITIAELPDCWTRSSPSVLVNAAVPMKVKR